MSRRPFDFGGRHALVTGCGSAEGIGFAAARMLGRLGARVTISSTTDRIEQRATELRVEAVQVDAHVADLTVREEALALAASGAFDVLVNAAGMVQTGTPPVSARFADLAPDDLQRELEVT